MRFSLLIPILSSLALLTGCPAEVDSDFGRTPGGTQTGGALDMFTGSQGDMSSSSQGDMTGGGILNDMGGLIGGDAGHNQDAGGDQGTGDAGNGQQGDMERGDMTRGDMGSGQQQDMTSTDMDDDMSGQTTGDMTTSDMGGQAGQDMGQTGQGNAFDDDFSAASSLNDWQRRHMLEGTQAQYSLLDVDTTTSGALTIEPTRTQGWDGNNKATLLFKAVNGNFSVETDVTTLSRSNPQLPPTAAFNSAGLMARDLTRTFIGENHVMVNVGRQDEMFDPQDDQDSFGTRTKDTSSNASATQIQPGELAAGKLILCRIGSTFYAYSKLKGEQSWTLLSTYDRPDMPDLMQVGMIAQASTRADLRATFDYIRLSIPASQTDCTP